MSALLINIDVPDMEKAIQFYTTALPLKPGRRFDDEFVELLGLPAPIYLLKKDPGTNPIPGDPQIRTHDRHWWPVHLDIVVEDIETAREKLLAAGAVEEAPVTQKEYGKLSMYRDPFGHGLCLLQFTGRGYDELL